MVELRAGVANWVARAAAAAARVAMRSAVAARAREVVAATGTAVAAAREVVKAAWVGKVAFVVLAGREVAPGSSSRRKS